MTEETRLLVEAMLQRGEREKAIQYLCNLFNLSEADATRIADALESNVRSSRWRAMRSPRVVLKTLAALLMFGALFCLAGASLLYQFQSQSIRNSDHLQGKVTALQYRDAEAAAPVIDYEWKGEARTYESSEYESPPAYHAGQTVWLYVDRNDGNVIIDRGRDRWSGIAKLAFSGAVAAVISIVCSQIARRKF